MPDYFRSTLPPGINDIMRRQDFSGIFRNVIQVRDQNEIIKKMKPDLSFDWGYCDNNIASAA